MILSVYAIAMAATLVPARRAVRVHGNEARFESQTRIAEGDLWLVAYVQAPNWEARVVSNALPVLSVLVLGLSQALGAARGQLPGAAVADCVVAQVTVTMSRR